MAYRRGVRAIVHGVALTGLGMVAGIAWRHGFWGTLAGATLICGGLLMVGWQSAARTSGTISDQSAPDDTFEALPFRLLLDQLPIPLLSLEAGVAHALNRPARALFSTDDRILAPPAAIVDGISPRLVLEGKPWRIDRVDALGTTAHRTIVALIDIDLEERSAEVRATAEMIQILGHEVLNGLAPIVSLAESGLVALDSPNRSETLLPEILGTLARRADGLLRFAEAYRAMARLPEPARSTVLLSELIDDLDRLFSGRWANIVSLEVDCDRTAWVWIDRDQMTQAVWALLQNGAEAAVAAEAPPRVALKARFEEAMLRITVSDSGMGVAHQDARRIFRPFQTNKPDGTGIGLTLARQIVHAHGGALTLPVLQPATFKIAMPAAPPAPRPRDDPASNTG